MADSDSKRTFEIKDHGSQAKLNGVQLAITDLEKQALDLKASLPHIKGRLAACQLLAQQVVGLCDPINAALREKAIEPEIAKAKVEGIRLALGLVSALNADTKGEAARVGHEADGLKKAADRLSGKWAQMAAKYEHQERVEREESEAEEQAELDALEEQRKAAARKTKTKTKVAPKGRKKAAKKTAKKTTKKA